MVSEVIEVVEEFLIPRHLIWQTLVDPAMYPRLFAGIGSCDRVRTDDIWPVVSFRFIAPDHQLRTLTVVFAVGRRYEAFDLRVSEHATLVSVLLHGEGASTRVVVRILGLRQLDEHLGPLRDKEVAAWIRRGLDRVADCALGARTSTVTVAAPSALRGYLRRGRPRRIGLTIVDDWGTTDSGTVRRRTRLLAASLVRCGLKPRDRIGLLARNHVEMVECVLAARAAGIDTVLLYPGMSPEHIQRIVEDQSLSAIFVDGALERLVRAPAHVWVFSTDGNTLVPDRTSVEGLVGLARRRDRRFRRPGRMVLYTAGGGGIPRGAGHSVESREVAVTALLSRVSVPAGERILVAAPLSYGWGATALDVGLARGATLVLSERFDPEHCLAQIAEYGVGTMFIGAPLLERLLTLPFAVLLRYDLSSLRTVASSGVLTHGAAARFLETFGPILYNVYGTTEAPCLAVATPRDLMVADGTVGRPSAGTTLAVLDDRLRPVPRGLVGRLFVRRRACFAGYADDREVPDMLDTGDIGYLDVDGRVFVQGRAEHAAGRIPGRTASQELGGRTAAVRAATTPPASKGTVNASARQRSWVLRPPLRDQ